MPQKLFKTGEFAKLCHTTKDTLFHYDRIGLLQPTQILPNGYRAYSLNQMYLFDIISIFKELGMSLEEIKHYVQKRNAENFIALLREKDKQLEAELALLTRRRNLLRTTLRLAEGSSNITENVISYAETTETYYIVSDKITEKTTEEESFAIWSRLISYCEKHKFFDSFITGTLLPANCLVHNDFTTFYLTSHIQKAVRSKYLHARPAGRYALKYVRCSYDTLAQECAKFYAELQAQNYKTKGALYQSDISSYLTETNSEDYLMLLEMKVE